jgi:hypothetical protein
MQFCENFAGVWFVSAMQARESTQGTPTRKVTVSDSPV